MKKKET